MITTYYLRLACSGRQRSPGYGRSRWMCATVDVVPTACAGKMAEENLKRLSHDVLMSVSGGWLISADVQLSYFKRNPIITCTSPIFLLVVTTYIA